MFCYLWQCDQCKRCEGTLDPEMPDTSWLRVEGKDSEEMHFCSWECLSAFVREIDDMDEWNASLTPEERQELLQRVVQGWEERKRREN